MKSLDYVLNSIEQKADEMKNSRPVTSETLKRLLYGVQEFWRSSTGEIVIVDSLVKLGTRKGGRKVVLFNEVSTGHQSRVRS